MSEFTTFLADCWRLFEEVNVPILNISFAKLYLGVFVVGVSIMILRPLLGIGGVGFGNNIMSGIKRGYDRAYKRSEASRRSREAEARARYNNSYEHYASERRRREGFAERYKKERQS